MRLVGLIIGVLIILIGAIGLARPDLLLSLGRSVITPGGLYVIAAVRIAVGLFFLLAAGASRAPRVLRVLGVIVILAGLATPWFGVARSQAILDWATSAGLPFMRCVAGVVMLIGGLLVYAFRSPAPAR
jgi:hypothetical protein